MVNAHHAAVERDGVRDGLQRGTVASVSGRALPPARAGVTTSRNTAARPEGEIHLGPGRELLEHGALVEAAGGRYRANASHNAGILYHEYGHPRGCRAATTADRLATVPGQVRGKTHRPRTSRRRHLTAAS